MNNAKEALIWITNILIKQNIPFQIADGLAAQVYGSTRKLMDIDIDIPEEGFEKVRNEVANFITFGPDRFKSDSWNLMLMTLNYHGQEIDLSGAYTTKIYNKKKKKWEGLITDFSKVQYKSIYGLDLPIIPREELLAYKKIICRPVDLIDVECIE